MTTLQDALRELAEARRAEEIVSKHIALIQADIEKTPQWLALVGFKGILTEERAATSAATEAVKQAALEEHALTGEYKPADGIQIKEFNKVVYEPEQARVWCVTYATKYLQLDTKAFEKAASVLRDLGAPVELTKEPRVQIATDLSAWLLTEQQRFPVIEGGQDGN